MSLRGFVRSHSPTYPRFSPPDLAALSPFEIIHCGHTRGHAVPTLQPISAPDTSIRCAELTSGCRSRHNRD